MRANDSHITDQDLLLAADGELTASGAEQIQAHLTCCWTCRARMRDIETTIADFVAARASDSPKLPPADSARALLKLRMAEVEATSRSRPWYRVIPFGFDRRVAALASGGVLAIVAAGLMMRTRITDNEEPSPVARLEAQAVPDSHLTPGAILPVTRRDLCAAGMVEGVRIVPASIARQVFSAYGIDTPSPKAYEVDYLITPALGGSDNIRNFWPQPYGHTVWNAHIKDALEDHLHGLVCAGELDLATAQQDIAQDWISAYRKYFHTEKPLPKHASFLRDRPWE